MDKNEFEIKRKEYKKNAFAFIMENIAKCEDDIYVGYNDEGYRIKLGEDNVVRIYDVYDDYICDLTHERPLDVIDKIAIEIFSKINNN